MGQHGVLKKSRSFTLISDLRKHFRKINPKNCSSKKIPGPQKILSFKPFSDACL
jgi:hypothetical protein